MDSTIDLSLFFENFHRESDNQNTEVTPAWPALQNLELEGCLVNRGSSKQEHPNDLILKLIGRPTKSMPKLTYLRVYIDSRPWSQVRSNELRFVFGSGSYLNKHHDSEQFCLSVQNHIPSSSAINVWRRSLLHTKIALLAVEFNLDPKYDCFVSGGPSNENWHTWENWQTDPATCAFQGSKWVGSSDN